MPQGMQTKRHIYETQQDPSVKRRHSCSDGTQPYLFTSFFINNFYFFLVNCILCFSKNVAAFQVNYNIIMNLN